MLKRLSKDVQSRVFNDLSGGAFFKALSDVKRKEVLDALSKAEIARMNMMHEGMMKRQPPSRQQMDQIKKDADESVRAIVGEAAYSEYQSYMSNQPHRMVVN
jgi:hypothetical protein